MPVIVDTPRYYYRRAELQAGVMAQRCARPRHERARRVRAARGASC